MARRCRVAASSPSVESGVIAGRRRREEGHSGPAQLCDAGGDVAAGQGDVLDALAAIGRQVFGDLAVVVGAFVDRNADPAAGADHGTRMQAAVASLDVEAADLAEAEDLRVERRPGVHPAAMHIVGEMVDLEQPDTFRRPVGRQAFAPQRAEVDIPDRPGIAVAVHQIGLHLGIGIARRDTLAHDDPKLLCKRGVRVRNRLVLTNETPDIFVDPQSALFKGRIGQRLIDVLRASGAGQDSHDEGEQSNPVHPYPSHGTCLSPRRRGRISLSRTARVITLMCLY